MMYDVLQWWFSVSKYVCVMICRDSTLGEDHCDHWLCSLPTNQILGYNWQVPPPVQVLGRCRGVRTWQSSADWLRRYNTTNDIWEILFSNLSSPVQHTHLSSVISLLLTPGYFPGHTVPIRRSHHPTWTPHTPPTRYQSNNILLFSG